MGPGRPKQLLQLGDRSAVRRCAGTLLAAGLREIVVVVRAGSAVGEELRGLAVRLAVNPVPGDGMAGSVRVGLDALAPGEAPVLVALADHPLVRPETVRAVVEAHRRRPEAIVVPVHAGRRGHPALFPRGAIARLSSGGTLRDVREGWPGGTVHVGVEDEGVALDMDTPADYARALALLGEREGRAGAVPEGGA